jgi:hypothetical protein
MRWVKFCFFAALLFFAVAPSSAQQNDGEFFAEGRIALDKYKDCAASLNALKQVSEAGQQNPMWIYYMAKANECAGNIADALAYYRAYATTNSSPEITDKVAELQYQLDRQNAERQDQLNQQKIELEKANQEREENQNRLQPWLRELQDPAKVAAARQNLQANYQRLQRLIAGKFSYVSTNHAPNGDIDKTTMRYERTNVTVMSCTLSFHEKEPGGSSSDSSIALSGANFTAERQYDSGLQSGGYFEDYDQWVAISGGRLEFGDQNGHAQEVVDLLNQVALACTAQ